MIESDLRPVVLKSHPPIRFPVELRWESSPVQGPFHGAFLPGSDERLLIPLISMLTADQQRATRVLQDEAGWTLILLAGEMDQALTAWPLKRLAEGTLVFHPADVHPVPDLPPNWGADRGRGTILVGRVEKARVVWSQGKEEDRLLPGHLLYLDVQARPFHRRESTAPPLEPAPKEFPTFGSEELPKQGRFEREEEERLSELPETKQPWWSGLFRRNRPPSAVEWEDLLRPGLSIAGAVSSVASWIGAALGSIASWFGVALGGAESAAGAVTPSFLSRLFDRQSSMFDRLAKLFERGDLEVALKHSIPIDNDLVKALKQSGLVSLSWQLPENLVDYSFGRLNRGGRRPTVLGSNDQIGRLSMLYRRAAENLSKEGRHRQAAYTYAHLLKDYGRAAQELEAGGFHLEAATLHKEKLKNTIAAAQVLERGGYVPEAVALYLEDRAFDPAVALCDRAGMAEESRRCLGLWLEDLKARGLRLQAGDLLRDRLSRLAEARTFYRAELTTAGGMQGEAGARLVAVEYAEGGRTFEEWARSEAFLRTELADTKQLTDPTVQISKFHRAVRKWMRTHPLEPEHYRFLLRKTRESLTYAVREAQIRQQESARQEVVSDLSELLEDMGDPMAVDDLRRGLTLAAVPFDRPRTHRRVGGGIRATADRRFLCWARDQWAWMDASAGSRTAPRRLPSLPVSLAIYPVPEKDGSIRAGMITHDHRLTLMRFSAGQVEVLATQGLPGALSIVADSPRDAFLVGTSEGTVFRTTILTSGNMSFSPCIRQDANSDSVRILESWGAEPLFLAAGQRSEALIFTLSDRPEDLRMVLFASMVGPLDHVAIREDYAFCTGKESAFGWFAQGMDSVLKVEAGSTSAIGVTCVGFCGLSETGMPLVAIGYQDGRLILARLAVDSSLKPELELETSFRTSLGPIVAIQAVSHGRTMVIDADFKCAMLDSRGPSIVYEGRWEQP